MPATGTRKVNIDGKPVFLPEEEARIIKLISDGCELQALIAGYTKKLKAIKVEIARIAERHRNAQASVTIPSATGQSAVVKWTRELVVDSFRALEIREELGKYWEMVFSVKPKFAMAKGYKAFMNGKQGPEIEKLKLKIAKAFSIKVHEPSVILTDIATDIS